MINLCVTSAISFVTSLLLKPTMSARMYDPLGLLSLVAVQFKMLFQDVCAARLNWDEMLSGVLLTKWNCLLSGLEQSRTLCIPRCYFDSFTGTTSCTCTLIGFCDASQKAYAAVIFLRMWAADQCVTRLVASKMRVTPLHGQTIPRLELLSALLLARLLTSITLALQPEKIWATQYVTRTLGSHYIRFEDVTRSGSNSSKTV